MASTGRATELLGRDEIGELVVITAALERPTDLTLQMPYETFVFGTPLHVQPMGVHYSTRELAREGHNWLCGYFRALAGMGPQSFIAAWMRQQIEAETLRLEAEATVLVRCGYTMDELDIDQSAYCQGVVAHVIPKTMADAVSSSKGDG